MNRAEMIMVLTEAYSVYPQYRLEPAAVAGWMNLFGTTDGAMFRQAMQAALKTSTRFPTPGLVQEFLDQGDGQMLPAEAWEVANGASHNLQTMADYLRQYPRIDEAARLVGYDRIALCSWEERPFVKRDFEATYKQLEERGRKQELLLDPPRSEAKQILGNITKALPGVKQ